MFYEKMDIITKLFHRRIESRGFFKAVLRNSAKFGVKQTSFCY